MIKAINNRQNVMIKCPECGKEFKLTDNDYLDIIKQVKDKEFERELKSREELILSRKETELTQAIAEAEKKYTVMISADKEEIARLKQKIENNEHDKQAALTIALSRKDFEIADLKSKLVMADADKALAKKQEADKYIEKLSKQKETIIELQNELKNQDNESIIKQQSLKREYEEKLRFKDEEIERYKDFKLKQSNKLVGESLEQHCEIEFNKIRSAGFQNALFEKDNDASSGTKGDYVFRDFEDDVEYISIMFEMKNEMENSINKHKNEDFLDKLNKDRNEKKCEYAVLVSMLEPDNELYNSGIVDLSYRFPKMYVIRPQFFIPMITLLRNAARNQLSYRKQLMTMENQNIDVSNFENQMNDFKEKFGRNYRLASEKFMAAIEDIDKTIKQLEKTKADLISSSNQLRLANDKAEDLSIKRLTKNNPTMKQMFLEAGYKE